MDNEPDEFKFVFQEENEERLDALESRVDALESESTTVPWSEMGWWLFCCVCAIGFFFAK